MLQKKSPKCVGDFKVLLLLSKKDYQALFGCV
jgi:hypothetical protein